MLVDERKAHLRRTERDRRRVRDTEERPDGRSLAVQERFLAAFPPGPGTKVALYASIKGEVGTDLVRSRCIAAGTLPYYPRVMEDGRLSFFPFPGENGWVRGKYGLLEPRVAPGEHGMRSGFDIVVVPGVAFDAGGRRLGRGSGYYDRFLSGLAGTALTVGFAFSRQIVPEVPVDEWDVPVDVVVTEDGVIRASRERCEERMK